MNPAVFNIIRNPGYDIDARRAMNAMSGLDGRDQQAIDYLVKGYKYYDLWRKTDAVHIHALSQPLAARINVKNAGAAFNLTAVNTITHTPRRGTAGDGSTSYFTTGFIPSSAGGVFVQDSAHIKVYLRVPGSTAATRGLLSTGVTSARFSELLQQSGTGNVTCRLNTASAATTTSIIASQHLMQVRTGSTTDPVYRNGVAQTTPGLTSGALPTVEFYVHARNNNSVASLFNPGQISLDGWGSGLTANEVAAMYQVDIGALRILGAV